MKLPEASNFIEQIINEELQAGKFKNRGNELQVRFPPEPNGYPHIGHVKAMCINYAIKEKYGAKFNLRMDDTNPAKEDYEYVNSIVDALKWLGFEYDKLVFASDYYDRLYEIAEKYIADGNAYVCDLSAEEITATRGTLTEAGTPSPYRNRSAEENLRLFREMKAGKYPDGAKTLRAKIDMASPNINMRDPIITALPTFRIIVPAINGVFILCTILLIPYQTRLRASHIRSVRSNSKITVRSITGLWRRLDLNFRFPVR